MASAAHLSQNETPRRSILDLAPLELDCMNALWSLGEGTVRQIQQVLAPLRPRAYTTIMTIMDRLAHKGVVTRHKVGRAYLYRPNLTAEQARAHAIEQVVEGFFGGSEEALVAHVAGAGDSTPRTPRRRQPSDGFARSREQAMRLPEPPEEREVEPAREVHSTRLDESLL